ncbi:MAG: 3-phosphoshikimate 1-carboxyvinyltransferase [Candidatus Thorarchaeota archaeon]
MGGTVRAPPSKSYTHRGIVCGFLSRHTTKIINPLICDDTEATQRLSRMMGAHLEIESSIRITGPEKLQAPSLEMDCGGSATTLRIFTALSALTDGKCVLTGNHSLRARPMFDMLRALDQLGIKTSSYQGSNKPPIEVYGRGLQGGVVSIRGDISSQYISGLLLACSKAENETRVELTTHLESKPYVEMTIEVMRHFGIVVDPLSDQNTFRVPGKQEYRASEFVVPGDFSSAAIPLAAGSLCGKTEVNGLSRDSRQGDSLILRFLENMGGSVTSSEGGFTTQLSELHASDIDVAHTPDLVPILSVLATQALGTTRIYNAGRLRIKESDRLTSIRTELNKMGARINETTDGLVIEGPTPLHGADIDSHSDHRIAMACFVAALIAEGQTIINGVECVTKSYPTFLEDMQSLGAEFELERDRRTAK